MTQLQQKLEKEWMKTLKNASRVLLKRVKAYHRDAILILTRRINSLEQNWMAIQTFEMTYTYNRERHTTTVKMGPYKKETLINETNPE